ncbi:hypothetical protein [Pseudomonas sp. zfem002]|uniref:hypothetical protein n=1 Tax=Pseudomonas sp. zfem002 TaxID=3078197 RepID=UPI0029289772|nr:hypothetical protein [Pseudomonas sp. zfem002]MDU9390524.1 hypothetical protein [Pseudomonas sp. zfem002]
MRKPGLLIVAAWLLALGLNGMAWGQELFAVSSPGMVCIVQLMLLPALLLLLTRTVSRRASDSMRSGIALAAIGVVLAILDLLAYLHQPWHQGPTVLGLHWARSAGEVIGAIPTALVSALFFVCLLNCLLQGFWNEMDHRGDISS